MVEITPGACPRCHAFVYLKKVANLLVACDPQPVDAQTAVHALLGGRQLWSLTLDGSTPCSLRPARSDVLAALHAEPLSRPTVLQEHPCGSAVVYRPLTPAVRESPQPTPPEPSVGRTAPFSGPQTGSSSVPGAEQPLTERHSLDDHHQETVDLIISMLGATVVSET